MSTTGTPKATRTIYTQWAVLWPLLTVHTKKRCIAGLLDWIALDHIDVSIFFWSVYFGVYFMLLSLMVHVNNTASQLWKNQRNNKWTRRQSRTSWDIKEEEEMIPHEILPLYLIHPNSYDGENIETPHRKDQNGHWPQSQTSCSETTVLTIVPLCCPKWRGEEDTIIIIGLDWLICYKKGSCWSVSGSGLHIWMVYHGINMPVLIEVSALFLKNK